MATKDTKDPEKGVRDDGGEAHSLNFASSGFDPSETRRGSIYQVIPAGQRRMSLQGRRISVVDDIFGEIKEDGPNYRNVCYPESWKCQGPH